LSLGGRWFGGTSSRIQGLSLLSYDHSPCRTAEPGAVP
jgi:hypothetical protein